MLDTKINSKLITHLHARAKTISQVPVTPVVLATWEVETGGAGDLGSAWANSSSYPISKITRAKSTGGVAQVVQHLLCKCEALSSNPVPLKKKKPKLYNC
jgi:hypothetical protein